MTDIVTKRGNSLNRKGTLFIISVSAKKDFWCKLYVFRGDFRTSYIGTDKKGIIYN